MAEKSDYERAKELGLLDKDRWGKGIPHHWMSEMIGEFLRKSVTLDMKFGGDGDEGETMLYELDALFELMDYDTDQDEVKQLQKQVDLASERLDRALSRLEKTRIL